MLEYPCLLFCQIRCWQWRKWRCRWLICFCSDAVVGINFFLVRLKIDKELFALEFWVTVTGAHDAEPLCQALGKLQPLVFVDNGASQKDDSGPDAIAFAQKLFKVCALEVEIVLVGIRMKAQLLEGGRFLLFCFFLPRG